MSTIVTFFAAPDDASAALVVETGPGRAFASLGFGNFDLEEAVVEWESFLSDGSVDDLVEAGEPRIVAGADDDGGAVVFALSDRLVDALSEAEPSRLQETAVQWAGLRAEDGEVIDPDVAREMVTALGALARRTGELDHGLYCWVA
ncbi:hypothetical protein [Streptomyces sp. NBC_01294]|uniref:hypothetical protein n=1 Tax=Streptomyces sp. NBC_01294 TaxID=2903815 RepID=UPI002DD8075B|nr:hypothetical protein [Streptomyces sp. NBC_01294]WRZ60845.1 hypothetical protein OG534_32750 [Streptomyces sp. NBC_01294]